MRKFLYVALELVMLAGMAGIIQAVDGFFPILGFLTIMCYVARDWKIWAMMDGRK